MRYNQIFIGLKKELKHTITLDDLEKFVELTGDDNRLHVDKDFASKTKFKHPVVHGMLGASFISTIIGTKLPGDGALWFSQNMEFILPVRIDDTITVRAEVIKMEDKDKIVHISTEIFNQKKQIVVRGVAKVKIVEQEIEKKKVEVKGTKQKNALIIGATGGIGTSITKALANAGYNIAIHYNSNKEKAYQLKSVIKEKGSYSRIYKCDIVNEIEVNEMCDEVISNFKHLDLLVNCSTERIIPISFERLEWKDVEAHLINQIKGNFNLSKALGGTLKSQGFGKLITLNSQYLDTPLTDWLHYITGKGALHGFTKALSQELAPFGIQVNSISPGLTDTDIVAEMPEKLKMLTIAKTPLRRIAEPEDIANLVVFLASDKANFFSGETFRLNGGQFML
ncbi:MAG: SDR family oxidoreductase [Flavobacteriaceae bacterium]